MVLPDMVFCLSCLVVGCSGLAGNRPVAAATGGFDNDGVLGIELHGLARFEMNHRAISLLDPVHPQTSSIAAGHAKRCDAAVVRQYRDGHWLQETDAPACTVTTTVRAISAAAFANPVALQQNRITKLKDLRIRDPRVRHVRMDRARAVECRACAAAARYGFHVLVLIIAERQDIHRALG